MKMLALATIGLISLTGCIESETTTDGFADASQNVGERLASEDGVSLRSVGSWTAPLATKVEADGRYTKLTSDGRYMVYRVESDGVLNLFAYDLESGTSRMLNRPNRSPGGWLNRNSESLLRHDGVTNFEIVPGERSVIYTSDEEREGRYLLYQVSLDGGQPTVLSPSRAGASDEPSYYGVDRDFKMAPNGKFAMFKYHPINWFRYSPDLYIVDLSTKNHIRINPEGTYAVNNNGVSPNSTHVVFLAKEPYSNDIPGLYRLFSYKIEAGSIKELVPPDMQDRYRVGYTFQFSPNGEFVAYVGQASSAELGDQLFLVDIEGRARPQKLNHQLPTMGWVTVNFWFSSDSKKVLYEASDKVINYSLNQDEKSYYVVDLAAPGKSRHVAKMYGASPAVSAKFSPGGQKLLYTTSEYTPYQFTKNSTFSRHSRKLHVIDSNTGALEVNYLTSVDAGYDTTTDFVGEDKILITGLRVTDPVKTPGTWYGAELFDVAQKKVAGEVKRPSSFLRRFILKDHVVFQFYGRDPQPNSQIGSLTTFSMVDGSRRDLVNLSSDPGAVLHVDSAGSHLYFHSGLNGRSMLNVIEPK
ncbi:MAG: hypothetical protein IPJ84_10660 [Bdellovibrionales bacterium]|nr:hypothetical protein [Bdellovibrionales bacterium]